MEKTPLHLADLMGREMAKPREKVAAIMIAHVWCL